MENPATWGEAEIVVDRALKAADQAAAEYRLGFSRVRIVTDALREAGLLNEE